MSEEVMEEFVSSVHRLSVATITSLASSSHLADDDVEEEDVGAEEHWRKFVSAVVENWVGNRISSFTGAYLGMLRREFGGSVASSVESFMAEEVFLRCPHLRVKVVDKTLDKSWDKIQFECQVNENTVGLHEKIILDSVTDVLKILVWKKKNHTKEKSLLGIVSIPLDEVADETSARKWPIIHGLNSQIGWLKVDIQIVNRDKPTVSKVVPAMLSEKFHESLRRLLQTDFLCDDLSHLTLKYWIQIRKYDESNNAFTFVEYLDRKLSQDVVLVPVINIATDSFTLSVDSLGKSKRSSLVPKWTPNKKERRTSKEVLIESFSLALQENNVFTTFEDSKKILVSSLPWKGGLIVQQKEIQWKIRLIGEMEDNSVRSELDLRYHFKRVYDSQLCSMTGDELLEWDGTLSPDQLAVEAASRPFYPQDDVEKTRSLILVDLHRRYKFNNEIVHQALCEIARWEQLDELSCLENYTRYSVQMLFGLEGDLDPMTRRRFYSTQLPYIAQSLNLIIPREEGHNLSKFKHSFRLKLQATLPTLSAEDLLTYLNDHVCVILDALGRNRGTPHFLAMLMGQAVVEEVAKLASNFSESEHLKKTYKIYLVLLDICQKAQVAKNDVYPAFERFLLPWSVLATDEARQQVERVLENERREHGKSIDYWNDWSEKNIDWLEGAINVKGIFDTCHLMWRQIGWPVPARNIELGLNLFKGTHEVYKNYVKNFLEIVTEDAVFDKHELVIILLSVLMSSKYLRDFSSSVNSMSGNFDGSSSNGHMKETLSQFSDIFSRAVLEADDEAEGIVLVFVDSQRKLIQTFITDLKMEPPDGGSRNDTGFLLPYLDNLINFLHDNLDKFPQEFNVDGNEVAKFRAMLTQHLFSILDEEVESGFVRWKSLAKKKGSPDVFAPLVHALPSMIEFRTELGLPESPQLRKIEADLYPRSSSSAELVFKQIQFSKEMTNADAPPKIFGQVCFRIGYVEEKDRIRLELQSISNIVPRDGDKENNFSMTILILPLARPPFMLRQRTQCYHKVNSKIFEEGDLSAVFAFDLPSNSYDPRQTVIQFDLYHQIPYTFQKVFRGSAVLELDKVQILMDENDMRFVSPISHPLSELTHRDTAEYQQLLHRKDVLAKTFVDRYNKQRLEKYFFESQDWAKTDDSQITCTLISSHLAELVEFHASKHNNMGLGAITLKMAFHEVLEELQVDLSTVNSVACRLDEDELNLSIGVRVRPATVIELLTHIYPNANLAELKIDECDAKKHFKLRGANYNYHKTFVEVIAYDNTRKAMLRSKGERFFRGHVLLPLSDIHPIDSSDKFRNVAPKKYFFHPLDNRGDSEVLKELRRRKDATGKEYVAEFDRFRDGIAVKIPFVKADWMEPTPTPVPILISRYLDKIRLLQHDRGVEEASTGSLKYLVGYHQRSRLLYIDLKSIAGLTPLNGDTTCNFSLVILVLPSTEPPFVLKEKTAVFPNSTCLLFDLVDDDLDEDPRRWSKYKEEDKNAARFVFDLNTGKFDDDPTPVAEETFLMFELYLHRRTRRFFRGSFVLPLSNVSRIQTVKSFQQMTEMSSYFSTIPRVEIQEYMELEHRRSESEAKLFVDRHSRNKEGKAIYTFFPSLF